MIRSFWARRSLLIAASRFRAADVGCLGSLEASFTGKAATGVLRSLAGSVGV